MEDKKDSVLAGILAISGKPGLYKTISQAGTKLVVESLSEGKRSIANASSQIISLADVSIYGEEEEMLLEDIFKQMYKIENKAKASVSPKDSNDELKEYFEDVFPEYDKERVYPSDIKKVIRWYNLLLEKELLNFDKVSSAPKEEVVEEAE